MSNCTNIFGLEIGYLISLHNELSKDDLILIGTNMFRIKLEGRGGREIARHESLNLFDDICCESPCQEKNKRK